VPHRPRLLPPSGTPTLPRWRIWWLAIRAKVLPAGIAPVIVGTALAARDGHFALLPALAALAGGQLLQIGANIANDYFDFVKGTDVPGRKGPIRVALSGLVSLRELRLAVELVYAAAVVIGLYLIFVGGWPLLLIGAVTLLAGLAYSGGPFPLGYRGLGDLFVFLLMGWGGVIGTYFVQAHTVPSVLWLISLPTGVFGSALLTVNNYRDIETDSSTGKHTLAGLIGRPATRVYFSGLLALIYAVPLAAWLLGWTTAWVLLSWLTLPLALRIRHVLYRTTEGPPLNKALFDTASLSFIFSVLLSIGLLLP